MADKKTQLSIILATVDKATAGIRAVNARIDAMTKPVRDFRKALGELGEKSGLGEVAESFKGIGSAIGDLLSKVGVIGGVIGLAVVGLLHLVDQFDDLGKKAARLGVGVDFLAAMRFAAEKTGVPIDALVEGLKAFNENLGQARANTGRMAKFLGIVSPALLHQLQAAKDNAAAFDLLAQAMAKIQDPAKRAALAQKTLGDADLAPLFAQGAKGIAELRARYLELAGSQAGAADEGGKVHDTMVDLHAALDGVKAALVVGLGPALEMVIKQLTAWFVGHRAQIAEWVNKIGKELPGAIEKVRSAFATALGALSSFLDVIGGIKTVAYVLAGVLAGPLIAALVKFGLVLAANPVMLIITAITAAVIGLGVAAYEIVKHWDVVADFFVGLWNTVKDAFLAFFGWVGGFLVKYTPIGYLVKAWSPIADFFTNLWDGITGVFRKAWDFISGIVDKIAGAVDTVKGAVSSAIDAINPFSSDDGVTPVTDIERNIVANLQAQRAQQSAKVSVDFANMPRGARAAVAPGNTADVDLSMGYNLGFAP